ncbi:anthrone oxygenase family protein [Streptomyces sulphureus]|uniref:anthrone oxygenase family protein n=1 Tax=Streptomyces sulphureus TaxID=47758 RepID=UPI00036C2CEF|nr:anthrone oxygenase family protein [Streptomyces sulphureus]
MTAQRSTHARVATSVALVSTGLLAGAFLYGWAVEAPTFDDVPLDVHLAYRVRLMERNGAAMPLLGSVATAAGLWSAATTRGAARLSAAGAAGLAGASLLVTRFGNVPINGEIRRWAAGDVPADHQARLDTWSLFHDIRFAAAAGALVLAVLAADRATAGRSS